MSSSYPPVATPYGASAAAAAPTVPPTSSFTAAWVAYAFFIAGIFLWWPALLGLIVCYSKRGEPDFLATHHRWLIRTFWWSLVAHVAGFGVLLVGIWPLVSSAVRSVTQAGGQWEMERTLSIDWSALFATAGGTVVGLGIILCTWLWFIYRIVRGGIRLADAQPVP
jgi:uncharacterized membrane protein